MSQTSSPEPLITNDAIVLGLLLIILALIFSAASSNNPILKKIFRVVPIVFLCYFIPSIFNTSGVISGEHSDLYFVASRYLLPTSLVLLTLSVDLPEIARLGYKSVLTFFAGSAGIIIGGPLALIMAGWLAPDMVGGTGPDAIWRGMATIAGSWIGGGANQAAMLEVFGASPDLFSIMVAVDVVVANTLLAVLLYGASVSSKLDKYFKADATAIENLKEKMENYRLSIAKIPALPDTIKILGIGFGITGLAHYLAGIIASVIQTHAPGLEKFSLTSDFFWIMVISTTSGVILSFTPFKKLEGVGASRMGSVLLYILVATIGMKMNIMAIFSNPSMFAIGLFWISCHIILLIIIAKAIKAPFFFVAVGSQANVGGAASAPIVASAFNPSLAPVGVLLAVLGYAMGTYGAWLCGILMQLIAS